MSPADLASDTMPEPLGGGRYRLNLSEAWNFRTPSGGVLTSVALRAAQLELGAPELPLRSATTIFVTPVPAGPLEVNVEVLRKGGAAAQLRARLRNRESDEVGLELVATFARERPGFEFADTDMPHVPEPDAATKMAEGVPFRSNRRLRFFENLDTRLAIGNDWWRDDWEAGPARFARWFRYLVPQRLGDGRLDPLALPPLCDTMPPAVIQKLGPGFEPFVAPSLDLTVHFLADTRREWLLACAHARHARAGYGSAEIEIWDDEGTLVAYGTQVMMFRRPPAKLAR